MTMDPVSSAEMSHLIVPASGKKLSEGDPSINTNPSFQHDSMQGIVPPSDFQSDAIILLNLAVTVFLFVIVFVDIWIVNPSHRGAANAFPSHSRTAYVTLTTALASLISAITTGHIKSLCYWRLKSEPRKQVQIPTLLGFGSLRDQFRWLSISLSALITGLMTTAIVAGTSPSDKLFSISGIWLIAGPDDVNTGSVSISNARVAGPYNWQLQNGSYLNLDESLLNTKCTPYCRYQDPITLLSTLATSSLSELNSTNRNFPVYSTLNNLNVLPSALGVLFNVYQTERSNNVPLMAGTTLPSSLWRTADVCLPVFSQNPVSCTLSGEVTFNVPNITVTTDNCNVTGVINTSDPSLNSSSPAAASTICTGGPIGTSQIVLGAVNTYGTYLSNMMMDNTTNATSTSVSCKVDVQSGISFKTVHFDAESSSVTSGNTCTPHQDGLSLDSALILSPDKLAFASVATAQILSQNIWHDGAWDALFTAFTARFPIQQEENQTTQPFAFEDSQNYLEDLFGVVTAMVFGDHVTNILNFYLSIYSDGTVEAAAVRVGPGKWWAFVYVLPGLYALALLGFLYRDAVERRGEKFNPLRRLWREKS